MMGSTRLAFTTLALAACSPAMAQQPHGFPPQSTQTQEMPDVAPPTFPPPDNAAPFPGMPDVAPPTFPPLNSADSTPGMPDVPPPAFPSPENAGPPPATQDFAPPTFPPRDSAGAPGFPPADQSPAPAVAINRFFVVEGIRLGQQIDERDARHRAYKCSQSSLFVDSYWCSKESSREGVTRTGSLVHNSQGQVAYVNSEVRPARFAQNDISQEINRLSQRFGLKPNVIVLAPKDGNPGGVIATWGAIKLVRLGPADIAVLSGRDSPRLGVLVDFIGNLRTSAKAGLQVYAIRGGPGYLWQASYDERGIGTLRFSTVDANNLPIERQSQASRPGGGVMFDPRDVNGNVQQAR